jgi:hypothetical protein
MKPSGEEVWDVRALVFRAPNQCDQNACTCAQNLSRRIASNLLWEREAMQYDQVLLDQFPFVLQTAITDLLERYQRHLAVLEAEVAQLKEYLPGYQLRMPRPRRTIIRPPSADRPHRKAAHFRFSSEKKEDVLGRSGMPEKKELILGRTEKDTSQALSISR